MACRVRRLGGADRYVNLTADGPADVTLVLLSATWFIAIALVALLLYRSPDLGRCLTESYRAGEGPWLVRWLRRNLKSSD